MEDNEHEIIRLQELFRGRFTFEEAQSLFNHFHGDCLAAANFVIDEEPQRVRDVIGTENETVSKCMLCNIRYEAVPKEYEWGRAKYRCQFCGNVFIGFGQMGIASSLCFRCQTACAPLEILPGRRTEGTPSRNVHSCLCHNCFNRADGPIIEASCVHPRSLERQVVYASLQHYSTGSTVDTFLTQDDLASLASDFEPTLSDIDE
ncbi:shiftless antiviral inhibitor of ribosomal frameshifting protein homolog isoform X2 [Mytilus galloprovincialis]|uniref:shiftless antiviral inhibitor of ribosomal frameshifting protein homolog isoform X2 n=1 Tax=Mytilus galloprovincialis TaxID=29158 RepID=UPI003F7C0419